MSDSELNPTRSFKDFIGWAFAGMAVLVLSLVSVLYSSLKADVGTLKEDAQKAALQIQHGSDREDAFDRDIKEIKSLLREINGKLK